MKKKNSQPKCPTCGIAGATHPISKKKEDYGYCWKHFPSGWKPKTEQASQEVCEKCGNVKFNRKGELVKKKTACKGDCQPLPDKWEELKKVLLLIQEEIENRNGLDYCKNCGIDYRKLITDFEKILSPEREKWKKQIKL